jgi:hypothetical protein
MTPDQAAIIIKQLEHINANLGFVFFIGVIILVSIWLKKYK